MATSYYKNTSAHGVNPTGSKRVPPGGVVAVDGDDSKAYDGVNGIEKSGKSDYEEYRASSGVSSDPSPDMELQDEFAATIGAAQTALVSAPLQVVIGDDLAPLGPPSGVVTTKQEAAKADDRHAAAFGPNEAFDKVEEPDEKFGPSTRPKAAVVHNEQAEANARVEEVAQRIVGKLNGGGSSSPAPSTE